MIPRPPGRSRIGSPRSPQWGAAFQLIAPDLCGHGRSGMLSKPFRHDEAASHMLVLLDHRGIAACKGVGVSGGGNILLPMATRQPLRMLAMVLVSARPYFPAHARLIMSQYADRVPQEQWQILRRSYPGGATPRSKLSWIAPKHSRPATTT